MLIIKTKIYKPELSETQSPECHPMGGYSPEQVQAENSRLCTALFTMCQVTFFSKSCYEGQAGLELSQSCLCLLSAQVTGMCCLTLPRLSHPYLDCHTPTSPLPHPCLFPATHPPLPFKISTADWHSELLARYPERQCGGTHL